MWFLFALISAITAALVAIFGKIGLSKIDTTLATTIRSTIMAVMLIGTALVLGKFHGFRIADLSGRQWWAIVGAGAAGAISWLFYFAALKSGLASRVAAVDRLSLVFIIILSAIFLGEALTWKVVLGMLMMVGGAFLVTLK